MNGLASLRTTDLVVFVLANLINLLLATMFLFRSRRQPEIGNAFGWAAVVMAAPLAIAALLNLLAQREWWTFILPLPMILYCLVEFVLDFVLKSNFRQTAWVGPYLGLFYFGLMMLIGYTFLIGRPYGFITLVTYFIVTGISLYSYARVGHA